MPVPQLYQLYKDKALAGDSGTETFSIKRTHEILGLYLVLRAKNGATANAPDAAAMPTPQSSLTKIEVKSGSTVFKSYSGEICRTLATYRDGKLPPTLHTQAAGGTWAGNEDPSLGWMQYAFPINFTPKNDPYGARTNCMLPAPLYDSLDLVLEYNFTISATAGFVTGGANHVFDLYMLAFPPGQGGFQPAAGNARGAMQQRNILVETKKQDYTTVASGDEPFGLTLDNNRALRQLMISAMRTESGKGWMSPT
jgi:hypothetical protein